MRQDFEELTPLTQQIIEIVAEIPAGSVLSYGDVARMAGAPRAARQVARILSSCSEKYSLPWHRVINKSGRVALRNPELALRQILLLREEGLTVTDEGLVGGESGTGIR